MPPANQDETRDLAIRSLKAASRGVGAVMMVRAIFSILAGLMRRRRLKATLKMIFSKDVAHQAAFIGSYAGLFTALSIWLKKVMPERSSKAKSDAIAAAVASVSILLDKPDRRLGLAQYLLSRAAALCCVSGARSKQLPTIPYFAALVFTLAEIPIMSGYLHFPETMNPDYVRLIQKWSRDQTDEKLTRVFRNTPLTDTFPSCEAIGFHEGPCMHYLAKDFALNWWITAKMYVPLYCIPRVTFSAKRTMKQPWETVKKTAKDICYSGLMLSTYIFMVKSAMCAYRHGVQHREGRVALWLGGVSGILTGSGVLWEAEGRQRELAIYVVPQALTMVWNNMVIAGYVKSIPGSDVMMFGTAMAGLMYHVRGHRDDVKPLVRVPLEKVLDGPLFS